MNSERDILRANYLRLIFNGGEETIDFSNHEIRGSLTYVPRHATQVFTTQTGYSYSMMKRQAEYFAFSLRYENPETRWKFERLREYVEEGYTMRAELRNMASPFGSFPFDTTDATQDAIQQIVAVFTQAVLDLPEDFAFDRIGRGLGVQRFVEAEIRIYRSLALPVPSDPCAAVTMTDFALNAWVLRMDGSLDYFTVARNPSGLILNIDDYPAGVLYDETDTAVDTVSHGAGGFYAPDDALGNFPANGWYVVISDIAITLKTGHDCSATFTQVLEGDPPELVGDFDSRDFDSRDFYTELG